LISSVDYQTNSSDECPVSQFHAEPTLILGSRNTATSLLRPPANPQACHQEHVVAQSLLKGYAGSAVRSCLAPLPSVPGVSCPLCNSKRSTFYCTQCVQAGAFVHSGSRLLRRFSEVQLFLREVERANSEAKQRITREVREARARHTLTEEVTEARNRVKYYRHAVRKAGETRASLLSHLAKLRAQNRRRGDRLPEFRDKAGRMRECHTNFRRDMDETREGVVASARFSLKNKRRQFVQNLVQDIFPIEEVLAVPSSSPPDMLLSCLADAMRTSYIHGRWVTGGGGGQGEGGEIRLVQPCLPASGDYTTVYAWIASHRTHNQDRELSYFAHTVAGGLSLAAQLTSILSAVMGLQGVPRLRLQEFGVLETSEYRQAMKVCRLNSVVVSLCLAGGLHPSLIRPCGTLSNLEKLTQLLTKEEAGDSTHLLSIPLLAEWEAELGREAEELRLLEQDSHQAEGQAQEAGADSDTGPESDSCVLGDLQDWESLTSEQLETPGLGQEQNSSLAFVSSTVSSFLWGFGQSPKK